MFLKPALLRNFKQERSFLKGLMMTLLVLLSTVLSFWSNYPFLLWIQELDQWMTLLSSLHGCNSTVSIAQLTSFVAIRAMGMCIIVLLVTDHIAFCMLHWFRMWRPFLPSNSCTHHWVWKRHCIKFRAVLLYISRFILTCWARNLMTCNISDCSVIVSVIP